MLSKKIHFSIFLVIFGVLLFCFQFIRTENKNIKTLEPVFNNYQVMIELNNVNENSYGFVELNNKNYSFLKVRNLLFFNTNKPVLSMGLNLEESFKDFKNIIVLNGSKVHYYSNFSKLHKTKNKICTNNQCMEYDNYKITQSTIKPANYNTNFNTLCVLFLNLFSGKSTYFWSYLFIIFGIIFFQKKSKTKFNSKFVFLSIFLLAFVLRFNGFFEANLKFDDYYTLDMVLSNSFSDIFKDPGNPPLLYFLYKTFFLILPFKICLAKSLALFISISYLIVCKYFSKKVIGEKYSNLFLLLNAININFIFRAYELRSYVLQALLTVILTYLFFKILASNKLKFTIYYALVALFAVNLHYYMILLVVANFLFGTSVLSLKKKDRNKKLKIFILIHFIPLLSFLPYFLLTGLKQGFLSSTFNVWIKKADIENIISCVLYFFGGIIPFILYMFYSIKTLYNKNSKYAFFVRYSLWIYLFTFLTVIIISQYKPILVQRYFTFLIPLALFNITLLFKTNRKHIFVFFIWVLLFQNYTIKNIEYKNINVDLLALDIAYQYKNQNTNKNVYSITKKHTLISENTSQKLIKLPKNVNNIQIVPKTDNINEIIDSILSNNKSTVIFTMLLPISEENLKKYTCFYNAKYDLCIWKIEK